MTEAQAPAVGLAEHHEAFRILSGGKDVLSVTALEPLLQVCGVSATPAEIDEYKAMYAVGGAIDWRSVAAILREELPKETVHTGETLLLFKAMQQQLPPQQTQGSSTAPGIPLEALRAQLCDPAVPRALTASEFDRLLRVAFPGGNAPELLSPADFVNVLLSTKH
eukprot:RCo041446